MEELDQTGELEEVQPDPNGKEAESEILENIDRQQQEIADRRPTRPDPKPYKSFEPFVSRVYNPKAPCPPTQRKAKRELEKAIWKKAFDKIIVKMPLSHAFPIQEVRENNGD